jgi:methylenetetrahydrofolate reductase (NADPH)
MSGATDQLTEGRKICVDLVQEIREIKGVAGVHVMAYRQEEAVAEIIQRSGVLAGRQPWHPRLKPPDSRSISPCLEQLVDDTLHQ